MEKLFALTVNYEKEEEILEVLKSEVFNNVIEDPYILKKKQKRKIRGEWTLIHLDVIKGVILLRVLDLDLFKNLLRENEVLRKLNEEEMILSKLKVDDISFITNLGNRVIDDSLGVIKDGKLTIDKGPLRHKEGMISKIDRHKRMAYCKYQFSFSNQPISFCLEVPVKTV